MTDADIAGYLDRGLPTSDRDRLEDHLVECAACRENLIGAESLMREVRRPRRVIAVSSLVAVAAAALIMVRAPSESTPSSNDRASGDADPAALVAYGPLGNTPARPIRFVWGAANDAVSYRLTVSRASGASVWSFSGTDTVAFLPDSITIHPEERYAWVVDAILGDGTTQSTGIREFQSPR